MLMNVLPEQRHVNHTQHVQIYKEVTHALVITDTKEMEKQLGVQVSIFSIYYSTCLTSLIDVNECTTGTAVCAPHSICSNTDGSYDCPCDLGFTGDGLTLCVGMTHFCCLAR